MILVRSHSTGGLRQKARTIAPLFAAAAVLSACAPDPGAPLTPSIPGPDGVTVTGQPCAPNTGVTVVVDFGALDSRIEIGCATGEQENGLSALAAAGFIVGSEAGPGSVCTIEGLPTTGYPDCWYAGYWGYFKAPNYDGAWDYSMVGAADGPLPVGSVEGFHWTVGWDGIPPRVALTDLAAAAN